MAKFIQSDYDTAVLCAKELRTQALDIKYLINRYKGMSSGSKVYWKGLSGNEFRENLTGDIKRLQKIADEMDDLADDIVSVAKQLKDKDATIVQKMGALDKYLDIFN